jgi:predicted flap endonuclease-1-like 5' DNA nuclease
MATKASDLPKGIGRPAERAFALAGLTRLAQFAKVSEADLLQLHGVGPKAVRIIRAALASQGKAFADPRAPARGRRR